MKLFVLLKQLFSDAFAFLIIYLLILERGCIVSLWVFYFRFTVQKKGQITTTAIEVPSETPRIPTNAITNICTWAPKCLIWWTSFPHITGCRRALPLSESGARNGLIRIHRRWKIAQMVWSQTIVYLPSRTKEWMNGFLRQHRQCKLWWLACRVANAFRKGRLHHYRGRDEGDESDDGENEISYIPIP